MARDYKKEYANYHSRPEQIKRRAARNAARRAMRGRKELTDEKDVHHKDNNPMNNDKSNLSIVTKHYNRREPRLRVEDLRKWFGKGKKGDWVRVGTDGEIKGQCAREPGEGKPKCMPRSKAHSMDKKDRASSARRKRRADPSVDRPGTGNKPIMVKTDKKESVEMNEEVYISREYEGGEDYKMDQKRIMTAIRKAGGKGEVNDTPDRRRGGMLSIIATGTTGDKIRRALGRDDGLTNIDEGTEINEKFDVKYAKSKRGPIMVRSFDSAADAKKFLDQQKKQGMNGIISKKGVPVSMQRMKDMQNSEESFDHRDLNRALRKRETDKNPKAAARRAKFQDQERKRAASFFSKTKKESVNLEEKNVPTNPALWAKMKAQAKAKFDVYPSAYANGWAAKKYKAAGGGWKTESVKEMKSFWDIRDRGLRK